MTQSGRARTQRLALAALVLVAAALRLYRLDEMEYKRDEHWMYQQAISIPAEQPWPSVGMASGVKVPNAALSVLVFVGLAHLAPPASPVDLARSVVVLNIVALAMLALFIETGIAPDGRSPWRWGVALAAVNPFAVLLQRKLWAQSTLPFFAVAFLIGWSRRHTRWGAWLWGLLSALLGQIHMSGLFFAAAFAIWERTTSASRPRTAPTRWRWVAGGFISGAAGLVIWGIALLRALSASLTAVAGHGSAQAGTARLAGVLDWQLISLWPSFWWNWLSDAAGFGLQYSLGRHYVAFLQSPVVRGHSTWLALAATTVSAGLAVAAALPWAGRQVAALRQLGVTRIASTCDDTAYAEGAALGVFGVLMTATVHTIHRHYLTVAFPLPWVWVCRLSLRHPHGRARLTTMWLAQLLLSILLLNFIHEHHGAEGADYGVAFRWQDTRHIRD